MKRVLISSHDTFGLGSIRRMRYCGHIARPSGRRTRAAVRKELGLIGEAPLLAGSRDGQRHA